MSTYLLEDWIEDVCDEHGFTHPADDHIPESGWPTWVAQVCEEHAFDEPVELLAEFRSRTGGGL